MLIFSVTATVSCENFLEAERSRVASANQRLFRGRMLMVLMDFLLSLLPFLSSQRKGGSCPTVLHDLPGASPSLVAFPELELSQAGQGTQLSPPQAQDTPCTEQCKQHPGEKHTADSSKQVT